MGAKKGHKGRKVGRNQAWCQIYAREGRREKNAIRKLRKYLRKRAWNLNAIAKLKKLCTPLGMRPETFHELQHIDWGKV